ncbi:MAG TPA: cation:proton antiporter [Burkholderiales bacterium]|jgi:Kef-type K+ transport system membrane component KefB
MSDLLWFLPGWPPALGDLVLFGGLLGAGLLGGEALHRFVALPRVTGYVLVGVACGPHVFDLVHAPLLAGTRVFVDLALGLIMFELGHRFDLDWLGRNRWLAVAAVGESLGAFFAIYAGLRYFDHAPLLAACAAAVGTATSPAVVMVVSHELRASGQITERMLLFTAVNCVFAYVALMLFMPLVHLEHETGWRSAILHPLYLLGGAALLGFVGSQLLLGVAKWLGKREDRQFILLVALLVLVVGLARTANVPVVVALLTLGMLARNLDYDHVLLPLRFGHAGQLLFVVLFVLSGASLDFGGLGTVAAVTTVFVVVRFLGKAVAILSLGRLSGLRAGGAGLLSLSLLPMSGLAVVMVYDTAALYPRFGGELAAVVLSAVAVLEIIGPLATQFALKHAGETHPEA